MRSPSASGGAFFCTAALLLIGALVGPAARRQNRRRILAGMFALAALLAGVSWLLDPRQAVTYGTMVAFGFTLLALLVGIRSARCGDRIAWYGVFGIAFLLFALAGGIWIAMRRSLHAQGGGRQHVRNV